MNSCISMIPIIMTLTMLLALVCLVLATTLRKIIIALGFMFLTPIINFCISSHWKDDPLGDIISIMIFLIFIAYLLKITSFCGNRKLAPEQTGHELGK